MRHFSAALNTISYKRQPTYFIIAFTPCDNRGSIAYQEFRQALKALGAS
jgi:hypothetical protein